MKSTQLLEAIGQIDETLLNGPAASHHTRRRILRTALIAALIAALALGAAAFESFFPKQGSTFRMNNLSTGGQFTYRDGLIYQAGYDCIYKIDVKNGETNAIPLPEHNFATYLVAADEGIAYVEPYSSYKFISYDGSEAHTLLENIGLRKAYVDGPVIYTCDGTSLNRIDVQTGETTVLLTDSSAISGYFVDDTYIYAVAADHESCILRSRKDRIEFERLELSFHPQKVVSHSHGLYLLSTLHPTVLYHNGTETVLPFTAYWLHATEGAVYYLDEEEKYVLKRYDPASDDVVTMAENVSQFAVLENRYLCMDLFGDNTVILDLQTGEQVLAWCPE